MTLIVRREILGVSPRGSLPGLPAQRHKSLFLLTRADEDATYGYHYADAD